MTPTGCAAIRRVDDGKSTLVGRLLHDCGLLLDDQSATLERDSRRFGTTGDGVDFSLLLDGLEDERQQRITIDVTYRFFATRARAFVVADTPGHEQYTRNMAIGASNSELAVILVDARKGVLPQTKRHAFLCSLLGIRRLVLACNKMDLVAFEQRWRHASRGSSRHLLLYDEPRLRHPVTDYHYPRHPKPRILALQPTRIGECRLK